MRCNRVGNVENIGGVCGYNCGGTFLESSQVSNYVSKCNEQIS